MIVSVQTRLLGLLGASLSHSLSPLMQNQALDLLQEDYVYLAFEVASQDLEAAVQGIRSLRLTGVNVTIPYKQRVMPFLDELDPSASECGAVNVIVNREGWLTGYNTDGAGFLLGLKDAGFSLPESVLLVGGGGAARSVAISLAGAGTRRFVILDNNVEAAAGLVNMLNERPGLSAGLHENTPVLFTRMVPGVQMIVNCSPVGMYPHQDVSPVEDLDAVRPGTTVCDLIYNPLETRLLRIARQRGLPVMNGVPMLANQGALSLELWTGRKAPRQEMRLVLEQALKEKQG